MTHPTQPQAEALKACPFCGSSGNKGGFLPEIEDPDLDFQYEIHCITCGCIVRGFSDEKQAREGWNSRAGTRPTPELDAALAEAKKQAWIEGCVTGLRRSPGYMHLDKAELEANEVWREWKEKKS